MTLTARPLADRASAPAAIDAPALTGYTFRPMTREDAAAVHAVITAYETADDVAARTSADVTEPFEDPWWDARTDSLIVQADGEVCGRAIVTWRPGALRRVMVELFGGVHPDHRGRGVGHALLTWQSQRGRQVLAAAGEQDLPGVLQLHVGDRQPASVALAERHGFVATRWYHDMVRDLTEPLPARRLDAGVELLVMAERPDLYDEARVVRTASFAEHFGSEPIDADTWRRRVIDHPDSRLDLSLLAVDGDGGVIGLLLTGVYPQDWPDPDRPEGWIDLLGVLPGHRGRGIASALLIEAMRRYVADGMATAGLGVDADNVTSALRLYESLGFQTRRMETAYEIGV